MPRQKKTDQPKTTTQQLGSLVKSARDIMRKDKGLNGDLDRLPMLTWIMFLKGNGSPPRREAFPASYRSALPLARLGGSGRWDHWRCAHRFHQQR